MNIAGILRPLAVAAPVLLLLATGTRELGLSRRAEAVPAVTPAVKSAIVPAFEDLPVHGAAQAAGIIIWSHGRSLTREDSQSPSPLYLRSFAAAGWDVVRFNRPRVTDLLDASISDLAARTHALRSEGYRNIVLAGQSYGGFISLGAARDNPDVSTVIATAPAAYGSFYDSYASWRENAEGLYGYLRRVGRTRVAPAFFHGDDYDPGGRGAGARRILERTGTPYLVIDQPRDLVGHLAANSGLFVRRYAACLVAFASDAEPDTDGDCEDNWGAEPSAALLKASPAEVREVAQTGASGEADHALTGRWYGYYPNGREFMLYVEKRDGDKVTALYGVGPSVDGKSRSAWVHRNGMLAGGALAFAEKGRSRITFAPTDLGTLAVSWHAADGGSELDATARRID